SLAACGGGGGGSSTIDTGTPLASGPPAPAATPAAPAPSATPATPAPPAAAPAPLFTAHLLDPLGQAGFQGLNNRGQAAWTMADPNAPRGGLAEPPQFGRFFDGTQVQQVIGNRPAHVLGVNDAGQVVGQLIESSDTRVFRWSPDAPDALVVIDFQPGTYTVAHGMNRQGQVTGTSTTRNVSSAYRWTPPGLTAYEGLEPLTGAGTFPPVIDAQFINDNGTVAGISTTTAGAVHAALWVPGQKVLDLGSLGAGDVAVDGLNNANQVVGQSDLGTGVHHAYRWSAAEGMVDLGTLGGPNSSASAINASGAVVGTSDTTDPGSTRAFLWNGGAMKSLGTLGGGWSAATRINASGQVGGTSADANGMAHAFLWTADTGMVDLNTRVPTETARVLQSVVALADDGSMLVSSTDGLLLLRPKAP
ncbi:MAG: hypothetical protein HOQ08_09615, partial [Frateuria sp.]|nr:hypothetical protein [Frateuria sp.]